MDDSVPPPESETVPKGPLESSEKIGPKSRVLRILSFNIRHGEGMDSRIDLTRIARVIAQADPDLVALQEVDRFCHRSGNRDMAKELGHMLEMEPRFGKFMDFEGGEYGMAVLSRLPITRTTRHPLPDGAEPRCALEVRVRIDGFSTPISLVCIHNDWTEEKFRILQIKALLDSLETPRAPIILAGDFNGETTDGSMRLLAGAEWRILNKNGEKTWPSDQPKVEIDFLVIRDIHPISVVHQVIDQQVASDHRPILGLLTLPGERLPADSDR